MKEAHLLMQQAIDQGVFPGGVLHVRAKGRDVFHEAYGRADVFAGQAMTRDTVFDLASLTKPLATAPAVLKLVQDGPLRLDDPIGRLLPEFHNTDKKGITLAQLLVHTSGFPAHRDYFLSLDGLDAEKRHSALIRLLVEEPLEYMPGQKQVYSDLGYMVLKHVVETVSQKRLDVFVYDTLYAPLGIDGLFFIDLQAEKRPAGLAGRPLAATEDCPRRRCLLKGKVHDDNAFAAGGIAGQAGLFGNTAAVARFLEVLLDIYYGRMETGVLSRETAGLMLEPRADGLRTLGFDTPDRENSSAGHLFSEQSVGHLGFTGVSMWLDVFRGIMVLLFTNRIHPDRNNDAIKMFRPLVHDTLLAEFEKTGA